MFLRSMPTINGLILALMITFSRPLACQALDAQRELQPSDVDALTTAIRDEIYKFGYQKEFWGFETAGPRGPEAQFNIYVRPRLETTHGGLGGVVIYKYLPFGEVIRPFVIGSNGLAYLTGSPQGGFPWTQPSTKTLYMDDEEVCRDKHDWRKVPFEFDLKPSANEVNDALNRQRIRSGSTVSK